MLGRAISHSKILSRKKKSSFCDFFKRFRKPNNYSETWSRITYDGTEVDFQLAIDRYVNYLNRNKCNISFNICKRLQHSINIWTDVTRLENYTLPALEPTVDQETDSSSSSSGLVCDSSTISNGQNLNRFIKNFEKLLRFLLLPDHHVNGIPPIGARDRKHAMQLCISACDVPIPIANEWFQPVFKCPRPPKRRKKSKTIGLN